MRPALDHGEAALALSRDRMIRVANDYWWLVAIALLSAGCAAVLLAILPLLGWRGTIPISEALLVGGIAAICLGAWLIWRPAVMLIDPAKSTVTVSSAINKRQFSFSNISHITIQPSLPALLLVGLPPFAETRYDVVLCFKDCDVPVHLGLEWSTARLRAKQLADATRSSVTIFT
jgi:hypothetical protein